MKKLLRIVVLCLLCITLSSCDYAYWDCKREHKNAGYDGQEAAQACKGK